MNSKAIQVLLDEHASILRVVTAVENRLKTELTDDDSEQMRNTIHFFREYADRYHHAKEEDCLFSCLTERAEMLGQGIIASLKEHHESFRQDLNDAEEFLRAGEWDQFGSVIKQYLADLRDHIEVEDFELFEAAEDVLNENDKEKLYHLFLDKDRDLGLDRKRELEKFIPGVS